MFLQPYIVDRDTPYFTLAEASEVWRAYQTISIFCFRVYDLYTPQAFSVFSEASEIQVTLLNFVAEQTLGRLR